VPSVRRYREQTKRFTKPLFPSYVFAEISPETKSRVYQQDLLVRAIWIEDQTGFLRQLDDVKTVVASGLELTLHPLLKKGTRVKVSGGALYGIVCSCECRWNICRLSLKRTIAAGRTEEYRLSCSRFS
jgi:hypothetical protein